ncbi:GlxA family transcriptional regulator [Taklimakanibacter lacteus]|uniref:GlxA family transcriptional regulator n=1 Tax=Taklimakanibacter lacteus TaxID=2268456 RepID=UPI000E666A57
MTAEKRPLNVAILALPEVSGSTLHGMFDLFASAGRDWTFLTEGRIRQGAAKPYIVARENAPIAAFNGVTITPHHALRDCPSPDLICVSDFFIAPRESCAGRFGPELEWLRQHYRAGTVIAAACSGTLLLAEAGLLDGHQATTHWGYCEALAEMYPKVRVQCGRTLVTSGEEQRIIMSGGGTSFQDLALFLIARFIGVEEAVQVAKVYLLDWHDSGGLPYAAMVSTRKSSDAQIAKCQEWLADNYKRSSPVALMVEMSGLAERSFNRRFFQTTGQSPMDYVQSLRLEEAKQILETTALSIEAVAQELGYEDTSFFSRLFRRRIGVTPAQYRKRFASLRKALQSSRSCWSGLGWLLGFLHSPPFLYGGI